MRPHPLVLSAIVLASCAPIPTPAITATPAAPPQWTPTTFRAESVPARPTIEYLETLVASLQDELARPTRTAERVRQLLSVHDPSCPLPCWWGITPGATSLDEAKAILSPIASREGLNEVGARAYYGGVFPVGPKADLEIDIVAEDGIVERIQVTGEDWRFRMTEALHDLGPPGEIWLHSWSSYPGLTVPVGASLVYPEMGVLLNYGAQGVYDEGQIRACFTDTPSIRLWAQGTPRSFAQVKEAFDLRYDGIDLPVIQALAIDPAKFHDIHQGREWACIETPARIWPNLAGMTPTPG